MFGASRRSSHGWQMLLPWLVLSSTNQHQVPLVCGSQRVGNFQCASPLWALLLPHGQVHAQVLSWLRSAFWPGCQPNDTTHQPDQSVSWVANRKKPRLDSTHFSWNPHTWLRVHGESIQAKVTGEGKRVCNELFSVCSHIPREGASSESRQSRGRHWRGDRRSHQVYWTSVLLTKYLHLLLPVTGSFSAFLGALGMIGAQWLVLANGLWTEVQGLFSCEMNSQCEHSNILLLSAIENWPCWRWWWLHQPGLL